MADRSGLGEQAIRNANAGVGKEFEQRLKQSLSATRIASGER
jgi:hypothetical protein